jgi:predicted dehydrogenase
MSLPPLRFGVVGLGEFGEVYVRTIQDLAALLNVEVVAVSSRTESRAQELATRYGIARWYTNHQDLTNDPEVDVVCVVTTEHEHFAPVMAALAAGKDVIVEKPVATSFAEATTMVETARGLGRSLLVGHLLRYETRNQVLQAQVAAGELGQLVSLHARRNRPAAVVGRYRRTHPVLETGILDLDTMLWLTGGEVVRVQAVTRTVNPGQNPDLVWAMLEFADGCVGVLETSWLAPDSGLFADDCFSLIGTKGSARLDVSRASLTAWTDNGLTYPDTGYSPLLDDGFHGAFREQLIQFIAALRREPGQEPVPLDDVLQGLKVALAIIESGATGGPVELASFSPA